MSCHENTKIKNSIIDASVQIDILKEYIESELCKKCEEMKQKLDNLQNILMHNLEIKS